jgi:hypothetical protein
MIRALLVTVGVASRPEGFQRRQPPEPAPAPLPRPAVEIAPDVTGRLRIPMRTPEERRLSAWTVPELRAIEVELRAGRVQRGAPWCIRTAGAPRHGRSKGGRGWPGWYALARASPMRQGTAKGQRAIGLSRLPL